MSLFNKRSSDDKQDDVLRDKKKPESQHTTQWKKAFNTLKLDKHRRLERRIVFTGCALFILLSGVGISHHHKAVQDYLESQQLTNYNSQVTFSKSTSVSMTIQKLRISNDGKTAFIPFTFSDLSSISADADNYYVIVLPTTGKLQYYPSGQFILFGTSGRGVIELHNEGGFKSQPLRVLLRNDKNLSGSDDDANSDITDESGSTISAVEQKYDMLDFTVNPGGSDASSIGVGSSNTPTELYNALFGQADAKKVTDDNKSAQKQINTDKARAAEYRQRLATQGFNVPADPKWMADDWKPYDWVQDNGVPYNLRNKVTAQQQYQSAADGNLNAPTDNTNDPDSVKFPDVLKRADGSTTNQTGSISTPGQSDANNGNTVNGNSQNPSDTWSSLQDVWNDVHEQKRRIYSVNALTLFQIKVFGDQQKQLASVGSKSHFKVTDVG